MIRLKQVCKYGWRHAGVIAKDTNRNRISLFFDILRCYYQYRMWSNQYLKEKFYNLNKDQRRKVGAEYREKGLKRDAWQKDFRDNRKFLIKYSNMRYERASLREKRRKAYSKRFNIGENALIEYDVNISRAHYLEGTIKIGKNALIAKHVFIDYSGKLEIGDNVQLTNGVIIETHHHPWHSDFKDAVEGEYRVPTELKICDGAMIGSRAIILPSCHYIGLNARIGAGAVVTKDVPDYAVVAGVPAKVIRIQEPK